MILHITWCVCHHSGNSALSNLQNPKWKLGKQEGGLNPERGCDGSNQCLFLGINYLLLDKKIAPKLSGLKRYYHIVWFLSPAEVSPGAGGSAFWGLTCFPGQLVRLVVGGMGFLHCRTPPKAPEGPHNTAAGFPRDKWPKRDQSRALQCLFILRKCCDKILNLPF